MTGKLRISALFAILVLVALSSFAQSNPGWRTARDITEGNRGSIAGTVVDVDEGRGRLQVEPDQDQHSRVTVETDSVATQYNGFGGMIAGKPEIFTGSSGLANIRLNDRIEVRGTGRGTGVLIADSVTLLGRAVEASQVGVGQTRSPGNISTSVDDRPTGRASDSDVTGGVAEGTVRQVNAEEGRVVIQTAQRRMITIRTFRNTPVYYRNERYAVTNLEVGDRIRVEADARTAQADEITARRIDVIQGVQDTANAPQTGGTITTLSGRVSRVDPGLDHAYITTGREEIRVDMSRAENADGRRTSARDLRVGDEVDISGNYNRVGDIFIATTVRFSRGAFGRGPAEPEDEFVRYGVVTINAVVTETLEDATTLGLRDRDSRQPLRLWVTEDFIVKLKAGTSTAERLRANDDVRIRAFRDPNGNLIAQTITVRNR